MTHFTRTLAWNYDSRGRHLRFPPLGGCTLCSHAPAPDSCNSTVRKPNHLQLVYLRLGPLLQPVEQLRQLFPGLHGDSLSNFMTTVWGMEGWSSSTYHSPCLTSFDVTSARKGGAIKVRAIKGGAMKCGWRVIAFSFSCGYRRHERRNHAGVNIPIFRSFVFLPLFFSSYL